MEGFVDFVGAKGKKLLGMENEWEWPKIVLEFEGEYK